MRKLLKLLSAVMLVALCLLALAACGKCRHKETAWEIEKEATCTIVGKKVEKCIKCDEVLNTREIFTDCVYVEGVCVYCGEARYGSEALVYRPITLNGIEGYEIVMRGSSTAANLDIPALHNGKPVLSIADSAFQNDNILKSLTLGKNLQKIGERAFANCTQLAEVAFAADCQLQQLGDGAFAQCVALTAFAVPAGVVHLPQSLFDGCRTLAEVTLHDGLLTLGDGVFEGCDVLQTHTEGAGQYLGTANNPYFVLMHIDRAVAAVEIPATVKIVASGAFNGCSELTAVALPEGVLTLGANAFAGCVQLADISLPSTLAVIGDNAFWACSALQALTLPAGVTEIGAYAFKNCSNLSALTLSASLSKIGDYAFLGTAIAELVLPASLEMLGPCAFAGCQNLAAVMFEAQTGWKIGENMTAGTLTDVSDAAANAERLTGEYLSYYWYR